MYLPFIAALSLALSAVTPAVAQPKSGVPKTAAAPLIKPGLWEIVNAIDTSGSNVKRTVTARTCYSPDDVTRLERVVPLQREAGMKCENRDIGQQGSTIDWRVVCTGKDGSMSGTGKMTLANDSYAGQAKLDSKTKGKPAKLTQAITAKWLGDCK